MSNISDAQDKIKEPISDSADLADIIVEINKIKDTLNYILELIKTRKF